MPINYPSNPSDGDTFTHGGVTYVYDATPGLWKGEFSVPTIPADVSDLTDTTSLLFDGAFSSLTGTPTTLSGYGITDGGGGGLGGSTSSPTSEGSGTSVTVTDAGLYYFNGARTGTGTSGTATVSGATISGQMWATPGENATLSVSFVTGANNSMSVGLSKATSSAPNTGFGGWVKTSGSTSFGGSNASYNVYKVD